MATSPKCGRCGKKMKMADIRDPISPRCDPCLLGSLSGKYWQLRQDFELLKDEVRAIERARRAEASAQHRSLLDRLRARWSGAC